MRAARLVVPAAACAALLAGCGGHQAVPDRPSSNQNVTLSVRSTPALGDFLVTHGWTLYMYPPDRQRHVTCNKVEECETAWPPLFVRPGHTVIAGPGVKASLIGTMPGDGGRVVTYNGWPLYYYIGDHKALTVNGQDQGFNWFVMASSGLPNKTPLASPTG